MCSTADLTLTTARLLLRRPAEADVDAIAEMNADPEVMRYIGDGRAWPPDPDRVRARIARAQREWTEHRYGMMSVLLKETGEYAGWVTLTEPLFLPEILPAVEIGWRFRRARWGHGYATEAARALLDHGLTEGDLDRVVSIRHVDNAQSKRVMEKLGLRFEFETVVPSTQQPVAVHAITRKP